MAQGDPRTTGYPQGTPDTYLGSREATRTGPGAAAVNIQEVTHGHIGPLNGRKVVAVTGTPLALNASAVKARKVIVQALDTNVSAIIIGGASGGVGGALDWVAVTRNGIALPGPYDSVELEINDLTDILINGTAGDGVSFIYWTL